MSHHPDPTISAEIHADVLEGHLATARAALREVLDLQVATPNGLRIKQLVRDALQATDITNPDNLTP